MSSHLLYTQTVGTILGVSVGTAALISALFLRTDDPSFRPRIQPTSGAFSIWGLIFLTSFLHSAYTVLNKRENTNDQMIILVCSVASQALAYILCALWVPYWSQKKYATGSRIITFAFIFATLAVILDGLYYQRQMYASTNQKWADVFCRRLSLALLSSWLLIAAYLSLAYTFRERLDNEWVIVILSLSASLLSIGTAQPFSVIPVVWAVLFSFDGRNTAPLLTSLGISLVGGVISSYLLVRKEPF